MIEIEPVDLAFEEAAAHLTGKQRKGESAVDSMRRIVRIRELLRAERDAIRTRLRLEALVDRWMQHPDRIPAAEACTQVLTALDGPLPAEEA